MMSKRFLLGAVAVAAMCASAASMAGAPPFSGEVTLAKAVASASEVQVDGVTWKCEADKCQGKADRRSTLDSQIKECRKVAEALGELVSYTSRGRPMTKSSVETCNRLASSKDDDALVANK
jgi:hypothetical protein